MTEHVGAGVIGQFLFRHATPRRQDGVVIILLDDVRLDGETDWSCLLHTLLGGPGRRSAPVILSPSLTADSPTPWPYIMRTPGPSPRAMKIRTNMLELFCYIMSGKTYVKWHGLLTDKSCWLWGLDLALHAANFKLEVVDAHPIKHLFAGNTYKQTLPDPYAELEHLKKTRKLIKPAEEKIFAEEVLAPTPTDLDLPALVASGRALLVR